MATLRLRIDNLNNLRETDPTTDRQLAIRMEITSQQFSRVANGVSAPGNRFIAGLLHVFGMDRIAELFEIVPDNPSDAI